MWVRRKEYTNTAAKTQGDGIYQEPPPAQPPRVGYPPYTGGVWSPSHVNVSARHAKYNASLAAPTQNV